MAQFNSIFIFWVLFQFISSLSTPAAVFLIIHYTLILQVDKLKILSESLLNSTSKAEKRILEQRFI